MWTIGVYVVTSTRTIFYIIKQHVDEEKDNYRGVKFYIKHVKRAAHWKEKNKNISFVIPQLFLIFLTTEIRIIISCTFPL